MLLSILITILIFAFITLILGINYEQIVYSATSILLWIISMAGQVYIVSPHNPDTYYSEPFIIALSLGMIAINIIWIIIQYTDIQYWKRHNF